MSVITRQHGDPWSVLEAACQDALDEILRRIARGQTRTAIAADLRSRARAGRFVIATSDAQLGYLESAARWARLAGRKPRGWSVQPASSAGLAGRRSVPQLVRVLTDMTELGRLAAEIGLELPAGVSVADVLDARRLPRTKATAVTPVLDRAVDRADALAQWTAIHEAHLAAIGAAAGRKGSA